MHAASWKARLECLELLIEAGADVYLKNKEQKKAVDLASSPEVASLLRVTMSQRVENIEDYKDESSENESDN